MTPDKGGRIPTTVDAAERIADYLSDDLAPDEREAFEAELAGDATLRAQLAAARRADDALASIEPTPLPDGFAERLRTALDAELAGLLAPAATHEPDPRVAAQAELAQRDDLAARRAARSVPRWAGGLAGAAAAVLVVVAGIAGLSSIGSGGEDAAETPMADTFGADGGAADIEMEAEEAEEEATQEAAPEAEGEAADEDMALSRMPDQPVLVAQGRSLDDDDLDAVLLTPELTDLAARQLPPPEGAALAADYLDRWQATSDRDDADPAIRAAGTPSTQDREAVADCLDTSAEAGRGEGIAAYAEVADFEGTPVVVLGFVTLDPGSDTWSVPEVQVLDRTTCDLLAVRP